jgi:L-aspartate oxidase
MNRIADIRRARAIVVGSGIAGLSAALGLDGCVVLTRGRLGSGSSGYAQGGIAAALGADDSATRHAADTVAVSGGIADAQIAEAVAAAAAGRIEWLQGLGACFDRDAQGALALGQEAGHSARRIVHAQGDATGAEVMRALTAAVRARPDIEVCEHHEFVDLIIRDGRVAGVLALVDGAERVAILAPAVVLATGGIGALYACTTNPPEVAGDGIAAAARAGARLADLEFVQFHPTALAVDSDPLPLLTEALRGEGAMLVNDRGERFMPALHADAELAPRDVVARAVWQQMAAGRAVLLDASATVGAAFPERFPTVWQAAQAAGIDPRREGLPVTPAEHYAMGGIATDAHGRSSLPGLWAVGECGATGLHGANRLASNSLLEGMVSGMAASLSMTNALPRIVPATRLEVPAAALSGRVDALGDTRHAHRLRELMWRHAGLVRDERGLRTATAELERRAVGQRDWTFLDRNLQQLAGLIVRAALARPESRGAHWRADHPHTNVALARRSFLLPQPERRVEVGVLTRRAA